MTHNYILYRGDTKIDTFYAPNIAIARAYAKRKGKAYRVEFMPLHPQKHYQLPDRYYEGMKMNPAMRKARGLKA